MKPQKHELSRVFTYHVKHLPESGGLIEIAGSQAVKTVAEVRGPIAPEKQLPVIAIPEGCQPKEYPYVSAHQTQPRRLSSRQWRVFPGSCELACPQRYTSHGRPIPPAPSLALQYGQVSPGKDMKREHADQRSTHAENRTQ